MGDGQITDPEEVNASTFNDEQREWEAYQKREKSLEFAVKARVPNAGASEIVTAAQTFEDYLTGKSADG